nr:T9SS type A sorting domain-containing protein [uncultured Flavobacterium sp.]
MKIKLLSIFVLFFLVLFAIPGYSQTQMISITNLKYTNGSAIPTGTPIRIAEGGTVSVTFNLGINNPGFALIQGGTLSVYSKLNSSTKIQHVSIFYGQNAISGSVSKQCTIELKSSHFPSGTGSIYAQFLPVNNSPILGTSVPVKTVPLITSNYIIGNQTVYEGDPVGSINGPTPSGGDGLYAYKWQQRIGSAGAWTTISGATGVTFQPTNLSVSTISYRRIVTSLFGTLTDTSNEITVTILPPAAPIQNNTISLNGNTVSGSLPTGGTGEYKYSWWYSGGEEQFLLPGDGQNLELPSWIHNETYERLNFLLGGLYIIRVVKSGSKTVWSDGLKIPLLPTVENNTISLNGNTITGSLPTGGTGEYNYSWWYSGGEEQFLLPGDGQNLELPSWIHNETYERLNFLLGGLYINRIVKSGSQTVWSDGLKIPLLNSNKIASNESTNIQSDLSVEGLITIYPNPTFDIVNFSTAFSTDKDIEITVYSENLKQAKSVFKGRVTPNQTVNWDIPSNYSKGVYFYKILSDNKEVKSGKFIFR